MNSGSALVKLGGRFLVLFFVQAEDGMRDLTVTGVQTCALPIFASSPSMPGIRTSMITTSGRRRSASATADSPSAASPITRMCGARERERRRPSRTTSWSSTIRHVISGTLTAAGGSYLAPETARYCPAVADWVAISSLATAGGTLALAGTTYLAVH